MRLKFLLKTNMRIAGLPHVFQPGGVYEMDAAQVGAFGLLQMDDGFGHRCFEMVKEPAPPAGPILTPEDVHTATRERRQQEHAQKRAEIVAEKRKAAAARGSQKRGAAAVVDGADTTKPAQSVGGDTNPNEKTDIPAATDSGTAPAESPSASASATASGKLAARIGKRPT